jgi:RNase P/RNase MRP subunit POP5
MIQIFYRKFAEEPEDISSVFIKGALISSLSAIFGEIGGFTEVELLKFDENRKRGILKASVDYEIKLRTALTLIKDYQGIPAAFQVNQVSHQLPALI